MTDRKWMPSHYMDEAVPPARPTPSDWITRLPDGTPALASSDPYDDDAPGRPLTEGDIIDFDWTEHYGSRELTFHKSDDEWTWALVGDEPVAPQDGDLNVAALGNWETVAPSLHEFASEYAREVGDGDAVMVAFYAWSRQPTSFVFRGGAFQAVVAKGEGDVR